MNHYDGYRYDRPRRRMNGARWAYDDEIQSSLTRIDLADEHYSACGLPLISDGRCVYVDNTDSHSLILGATGSKKTRLLAMPMMNIIAKSGESVICTDPKGELYERTSGLFAREGYRLRVINLRDPLKSNGWNPLITAQKHFARGERDRATTLVNDLAATLFPDSGAGSIDPFWHLSARSVFSGLCHMLVERPDLFPQDYCHFSTLRLLSENLTCPDSSGHGDTNIITTAYARDSMVHGNLSCVTAGSERTFMNILVSYNAPMQMLYSQESLMRMLSVPEIDFSELGLQKTVLYLIMPDEKTTLHGIVSLIIKQCYETLIYTAQHQPGLQLPVRVNFLLDEFANLPAIPDMNAMISAARSRNIRFFLVVQAMNQLRGKYGDDAFTIRSNCTNWVFLTSRELELLRELEELCGINQATGEALISASQLQLLSKETGEALVLCGRNSPYISHLADIDDYPFAHIPPAPLPRLEDTLSRIHTPLLGALALYCHTISKNDSVTLY